MKNLMGKTRPVTNPYEVWKGLNGWTWRVLKFNQGDRTQPYATAFCVVTSPYTTESGDMGDTYIADFESVGVLVETNYPEGVNSQTGGRLTDIPDEIPDCGDPGPNCVEHDGRCD